jgi:hypothetical protein
LKSRAVEEGGRAVCVNDEEEFKGAGIGISLHADQHNQSGVDVLELRAVKEGGRTVCANDGNEFEDVEIGIF